MMRAVSFTLLLAACGRGAAPSAPAHATVVPPTAEAQPASADDVVVATVDGHPVYGSCVAAQASALHLDRAAALDQCVTFELLAQAAEARGLRQDPDVVDSWRREMVRALIAGELGTMTSVDALPSDFVAPMLARQGPFLHRPEMRAYTFGRALVPESAAIDGPEDHAAKAIVDAAYAKLGPSGGVLPEELLAELRADAAGTGVQIAGATEPKATPADINSPVRTAVKPIRDALYANPALGTVSPPVRTQWGWDLVLWADTWPARDFTPDFFQQVRLQYFGGWVDQLAAADGIAIARDDSVLQDSGDSGAGSASGSATGTAADPAAGGAP